MLLSYAYYWYIAPLSSDRQAPHDERFGGVGECPSGQANEAVTERVGQQDVSSLGGFGETRQDDREVDACEFFAPCRSVNLSDRWLGRDPEHRVVDGPDGIEEAGHRRYGKLGENAGVADRGPRPVDGAVA